ncbi:MAG: NADH-quinone oxidoreductase subunit A [Candidatus Thermoplasmatota archaeon]
MLPDAYLPIGIFTIVAILFGFLTLFATRFFRPKKRTELKEIAYECGEIPVGSAHIQFNFQYYIFALIFVVFDVVTVFLLLWALIFSELSNSIRLVMGIFGVVVILGLAYALKKEATVWI